MALEGIDYAAGTASPGALKDAGRHFAARYLAPDRPSYAWKRLRADEAKYLLAGDILLVTVFESSAGRAKDGWAAGRVDARDAVAHARSCGIAKPVVYFAVDYDAPESDQADINAYLRGAASVLGKKRTGVYGSYYVVKRALEAGVCKFGWQTYAWSGGQWYAGAHLQQYSNGHKLAGVDCDFDRAMKADFGQWPRPSVVERVRFHLRSGEGDELGHSTAVRPGKGRVRKLLHRFLHGHRKQIRRELRQDGDVRITQRREKE